MEKLPLNLRLFLGASPPPVPAAAASAAGIKILSEQPELRKQLQSNVKYLRTKLRALGLPIPMSPVPIVAIYSIPGLDLEAIQCRLDSEGIMVRYFPAGGYSDVPTSGALKITIFAQHSRTQLDRIVEALGKVI